MEYPTDLAVDSNLDLFLDGANDLATISGLEQLQQSVALDVLDITRQFVGSEITGPEIGRLEARVERSLQQDEQLQNVQSVNVTEHNRKTDTIVMKVFVVNDDDFTLEVSA